ncbi:hypothetical protein LguiA_034253 [Lonicera macranthoides]
MQSPCIREVSEACFNGCCRTPFLTLPQPQNASTNPTTTVKTSRQDFAAATAFSLHPNTQFTNHESLLSLDRSFSNLKKSYPKYIETDQTDRIRAQEYYHLSLKDHVCLDYIGHGLFSFSQNASNGPFFNISYKSTNLSSPMLYGLQESEFECIVRKRIMRFMNMSEDDYSMVFTANQSSAFKVLADAYPFHTNQNLVTVYDHKNEQVEEMVNIAKKRGARAMSAEFTWPNMRIHSRKLRKMVASKKKKSKKGLFVFPLQSKMTGTRYSYQWMNFAQEIGWHVVLDASALGAKDMETLGLSLFQPDFLICTFFKIFGENPSGFACLFLKKTTIPILKNSTTKMGIVSVIPEGTSAPPPLFIEEETFELQEIQERELSSDGIIELGETRDCIRSSEIELRGLDHADSLGLILISGRVRYLINWLVNALLSLKHPNTENGLPLVRIYGPKIRMDRGPAVSFNLFDWKGEKIDPTLVQKLGDRNNISLSFGLLQHICFLDKDSEEKVRSLETRSNEDGKKKKEKNDWGISVITASLGFLNNFEDVYRLWVFVSLFLDADYVEKERWRYMALNRTTVEV